MKNLLKQLAYTIATIFFMISPAMAGQVELQTEVPIYEAKEGWELTEVEKRALYSTLDFFINNPDAKNITINSNEFPGLTMERYNEIIYSLDYITAHYYTPIKNGYLEYPEYLIYCAEQKTNGSYTELLIQNDNMNKALSIKRFVDYTYSLLPSIGITNGMDEVEAISILNNFVCDLLSYDISYINKLYSIYETRKGVCQEYAAVFKALANGAGIETYVLSSFSEDHAWNEVVIDGTAYELDTCWNDKPYFGRKYIYMLPRAEAAKFSHHRNVESRE